MSTSSRTTTASSSSRSAATTRTATSPGSRPARSSTSTGTRRYPIKTNARLADYPPDSEVYQAAVEFNRSYADFLELLTQAYNGRPALLLDAVIEMFRLRDQMTSLMHNPIPGQSGLNAAPTFEMACGQH